MATTINKSGRGKYTPELAEEICELLSNGVPLREICRSSDRFPVWQKVYEWMEQDPQLAGAIARAREIGGDAIAEDCLQLIDTPPNEVFDDLGNKRYDPASLQWRKNQVEMRLKLLAKWNPKRYGERTTLAGDKDAPLKTEINFEIFGELLKNIELKRLTDE